MALNLIPAALPSSGGWFANGEDSLRHKIALALAQKSMSTDPIQSKWQGYANMGNAVIAGMEASRERAQDAEATRLMMNLPGLGGAPTPAPQSGAMFNPLGGIARMLSGGGGGLGGAGADAPPPVPPPGPQSMAPEIAPPVPPQAMVPDIPPTAAEPPVQMAALGGIVPPQATQPGMAEPPRPPADIPNAAPAPGIAGLGPQYVDAIKKSEGFVPRAAWDYKQNTNGYGTRAKFPGEVIDRSTAEQRLAAELTRAAGIVDKVSPDAPSGARAALTSLTFNAGDKWARSGLGDLVRQGDWPGAQQRFQQYNRAGGAPLPGLVERRAQEAQWFPPSGANVPMPRPRPPGAPQGDMPQPPAGPPQDPGMIANAPVRLASLGGMPQADSPAAPAQPAAPAPVQLAQAGGQPPAVNPQRQQMDIPPQIASQIKVLLSNPKTRNYGMQLYQQYAKPQEPSYGKLNDEMLFDKKTGKTMQATSGYKPLTDPAERAKYGIPTTDNRPYQIGPANKLINPPPETRVNIDQSAPNEFEKHYGEGMSKRAIATLEAGDKASGELQNIQLIRRLNESIQTGKLTPGIATMGAYLQSLGVDPKAVGIDPNLPARAESMQGLSNKSLMGLLGPGGFPSQNFSDTDRKFLEKIVTGPYDRPETNELKLSVAERVHNLAMQKADAWGDAREAGTSYEKFERDWRKNLQGKNIFGDLQLPSVGPAAAPGAPPPGPAPQSGAPSLQEIEQEILRRRQGGAR